MPIHIEIHRPVATCVALTGIVGLVSFAAAMANAETAIQEPEFVQQEVVTPLPQGGDEVPVQQEILAAEEDVRQARQERAVLEHKEEILREQLRGLDLQRQSVSGPEAAGLAEELSRSTKKLIALLRDKQEAETYIKQALQEVWEAELRGGRAGLLATGTPATLEWPVEPTYGLSAHFGDKEYEQRFGLPHAAVDIPVEQGTVIHAAAAGVVENAADNGYGYSYIIIRHEGVATLYGHVSGFLVREGQTVAAGQAIALSGGRPGSKGAGALTTGPHLHFETIIGGEHVDPQTLLPMYPGVQ